MRIATCLLLHGQGLGWNGAEWSLSPFSVYAMRVKNLEECFSLGYQFVLVVNWIYRPSRSSASWFYSEALWVSDKHQYIFIHYHLAWMMDTDEDWGWGEKNAELWLLNHIEPFGLSTTGQACWWSGEDGLLLGHGRPLPLGKGAFSYEGQPLDAASVPQNAWICLGSLIWWYYIYIYVIWIYYCRCI